MGIKYFWKYLTSLNVVKEKLRSVDSKLLFGVTGNAVPKGVPGGLRGVGGEGHQSRIYVDILGCFYTEILRCVERSQPTRPYDFAPLIHNLQSIFPEDRTVFVLDGALTSAKSETSMKRHREWAKVVDELDKVAATMEQTADDGKRRMPKSFYEKLDRLKKAFKVDPVMAPGEADVFIGRAATHLDIVVSVDSDLFCYKIVKTMVKPTRHRGQYILNVLDKSLALRKMGLNADDLVVLAVVSGNDYESNIPGKAIVTNVKIFLKIKEKGDMSKEAMLKEYLLLCQSDRNFNVAKGVFFNFDEGKALDPPDRSKGLEKRDKSLALISEARALLVANRGNSGNEYLFKAHWSPNPFRPLQSKDEIPRYTPSTIDRTTPMKCPVPPVQKVSPKVVTFDDDQYQEPKEVPEAKAVKPSSKAKAKRAPSGRSNRTKTADDANSLGPKTSKKNFSEATKVIASLSKRCGGYRTIHVGHLRGHIGIDQQEPIARRINDAVGILNRARCQTL
ncbi:hypothetical protein SeLEV6574_g06539 [Synchytrium endobioticum]|uniref:Exonuclease 1 n=1 Tax=Synchytrium endobioticum TaxID=286115 RepID=A0A507CN80_9FUNG|nr:hypothetical protein SeLEV6574_g06539 [Synchytrium endobioticum]